MFGAIDTCENVFVSMTEDKHTIYNTICMIIMCYFLFFYFLFFGGEGDMEPEIECTV